MNHKQKNWSEWLASVEFTVNNKVYSATKVSSFIANYGWKLRIGVDIRRKRKVEKTIEFTERINQIYKEVKIVLKQVQEEIKKQIDRRRKKVELWKKRDKVILSIKDLVFKEQLARKLVDCYVRPYTIKEVVSTNIVKLKLLTTMRIHSVINMSWVVRYWESVKR